MTDIFLRTGDAGNDVVLYAEPADPLPAPTPPTEVILTPSGEGVSLRIEINTTTLAKQIIDVFLTDEGAPVVVRTSGSVDVRLYEYTGDMVLRSGDEIGSGQTGALVITLRDGTVPIVISQGEQTSYTINLENGAFVLSGINLTGLKTDRLLIPDVVSFVLTLNDLTGLFPGKTITTEVGNFTLTGTDLILVYNGVTPPVGDSSWLPKRKRKIFIEEVPEDIEDMKLSLVLMQKLAQITNVNAELMREQRQANLTRDIAAQSPLPIPKPQAIPSSEKMRVVINRVLPTPPEQQLKVSPAQHMVLLRRLAKANAAKAENKQQEERMAQQRLQNLAKARKVAKRNRSKK